MSGTLRGGPSGAVAANILTFLVYCLASGGVLYLSDRTDALVPIWPAAGVALAAVSLFGYRVAPAILLASLFALLAFGGNVRPTDALIIACVEALGPVVGVAAARFIGVRDPFDGVPSLLLFLAIAGLPTAAASVGTSLAIETWNGHLPIDRLFDIGVVLLLGHFVGIVSAWPLLESWWRQGVPRRPGLLIVIVASDSHRNDPRSRRRAGPDPTDPHRAPDHLGLAGL